MREKLIIQNFGPIKSVDLDLGKITVLIGEQASGKSTVAKVLAICRYFSYIVDDSELVVNNKSSFELTALDDWGLSGYEKPDTYIKYQHEDYLVEIKYREIQIYANAGIEGDEVHISQKVLIPKLAPKSEKFRNLLKSYNNLKPQKNNGLEIDADWNVPHSFLMTDVKKVMNNPLYFPTERGLQSIFSLGKSSIQNLFDSLFNQFAKLDQIARSFKNETEIEPLGITYKNVNGEGYFKLKDQDEFYKVSQGASGFKSALPIILGVKYYSLFERRSKTFIAEEPEINLFPEAQKKLVRFLVGSINSFDNDFLILTHSPYILTALENLMYAHKIASSNNGELKEEVVKIIDEEYCIDQKDVNVYYLGDGVHRDILQRDEALIDKDYIDSVSRSLNTEYDQLLALDVAMQN